MMDQLEKKNLGARVVFGLVLYRGALDVVWLVFYRSARAVGLVLRRGPRWTENAQVLFSARYACKRRGVYTNSCASGWSSSDSRRVPR